MTDGGAAPGLTLSDGGTNAPIARPGLRQTLVADMLERARNIAKAFAATRVRREWMAEEIAADVVIIVNKRCTQKPELGGLLVAERESLQKYVVKVTADVCVDHLRAEKRRQARELLYAAGLTSAGEGWMRPDVALEAREFERVVQDAVGRMNKRCKEAFLLRRDAGLTEPETGAVMGITTSAVSKRMVEANKHLRIALARAGVDGFSEPRPSRAKDVPARKS